MGLLGKVFGRKGGSEKAPAELAVDGGHKYTGSAAAFGDDEEAEERDYDEFRATVQLSPGVLFMAYLADNDLDDLAEWFHPSAHEPEPKGLIEAFLGVARSGQTLRDLAAGPIEMYTTGWPEQDGGPSDRTRDALAQLAGVLGRQIKLYYKRLSDDKYQLLTWTPE